MREWEDIENDDIENNEISEEINNLQKDMYESSFVYHAIPLDKLETLDEDGNCYSIKELMQLKDLKEELKE